MTLSSPSAVPTNLWQGPESIGETKCQTLTIETENYTGPLTATLTIGEQERTCLEWGVHRFTRDGPNDPERWLMASVLPTKTIDIVEGSPEELVVWYAYVDRERTLEKLFPGLKESSSAERYHVRCS